jgi:tryptophan synthase beta chain
MAGRKRIATETGAGQWGSALALGASFFGLEAKVYMVKVSYRQKPYEDVMRRTAPRSSLAERGHAADGILADDPTPRVPPDRHHRRR